ncbi:MAG: glycosyltransferase [Candidatus Omnitrophica bacterium]|nr:glycosyltransferase [Candidatus Omnitrophota bacterium]
MKILMVTNTYTPIIGGVERSIKAFASEFKKQGHEVLIGTLEFDGMPENEKGVVRVPAIRRFNGSDFSVRLPIPLNLSSVLDEFKPDIVHSHHPFILGDTALRIANKYQVPLVFTHHTKYEDYTHYVPLDSPAMKKFAIELTTGYAELTDHVFAPSQSIKELLLKRGVKTPIDVVPTGVDFDKFSQGDRKNFREKFSINDGDFIVGHIGRLAPEKNLTFLSQCIISFLKQHKQAKFLLVGKGPSLNEIKNFFKKEGFEERLIYPGVLEGQKLIDAYHAMDIFAFSSKSETQGMVLLEAMAAGVPVVALDASGIGDVIRDKLNGRLVKNEDVEEFKESLNWFFRQTDEQIQILKKNAEEFAASLSMEKTSRKALEIYESLLEKDFTYCDIENTPWEKTLGRIKVEWELISNLTGAVGSVFKDKLKGLPKDGWYQKICRWLNNNEWFTLIMGLSQSEGTLTSPGIVLIQIDGLSLNQLKKAMKNGKMPFLQKLLKKEGYELSSFYSGQPSCTPGVQGELFYGVKGGEVPSFSFLDQKTQEVFRMYDVEAALEIEKRLSPKNAGLLEGGSSYSNVYSGGAKETHFCAIDLGWDQLWRKIRPIKIIFSGLVHVLGIIRTTYRLIIEFISSFIDCIDGLLKGENFIKEIKFILTRLGICILLRDLITFGAKIDIIRGLPVIHVNFLGYDEHAHRRGPSSRFAHWTLKGIDRCIAKIYTETRRSQRRSYDVWLYSDHGQEEVLSYVEEHKKSIHQAIQEIFEEFQLQDDYLDHYEEKGEQFYRVHYLGQWLVSKISPFFEKKRNFPKKDKLVVTAAGPIGHIYLPRELDKEEKERFAKRLVLEAKIPLVLSADEEGKVKAWNEKGTFILPDNSKNIFGAGHPYLAEVTEDMIRTCHHLNAGVFTISGWKPDGQTWSFPAESGSHGGPGVEEINGFALLPSDILSSVKKSRYIRPLDLRNTMLKFMKKEHEEYFIKVPTENELDRFRENKTLRIMTYNVHGCKGMDSKIYPERIARVIGRHQPDIVALQELDMNRVRSGGIDQPDVIAKELGLQYHFHPNIEHKEQQYGNAVFSRFPIELICAKQLPGMAGKILEPRGAIWVAININGIRLQVINTHLGLKRKERMNQVEALLGPEWLAHVACYDHLILVGDINALPSSKEYKRFQGFLRDVQKELKHHEPKATWFGHLPLCRIDHIFVGSKIKVEHVQVPNTQIDRISSDHLPLIVDINISD